MTLPDLGPYEERYLSVLPAHTRQALLRWMAYRSGLGRSADLATTVTQAKRGLVAYIGPRRAAQLP